VRAILAVIALGAVLAGTPPAFAQGEEDETSPGELTVEAIDRLLRALDLLIESIPQYEAPFVNEDGDIIIRRKREPDAQPAPEPVPRTGDGIKI
jgi:hypothetical protein